MSDKKRRTRTYCPYLTWSGRWGAPIPWWYITSCCTCMRMKIKLKTFVERMRGREGLFTLSCWVICWWAAWLDWCFCMSTAASASARLSNPSLRPENKSPCKRREKIQRLKMCHTRRLFNYLWSRHIFWTWKKNRRVRSMSAHSHERDPQREMLRART